MASPLFIELTRDGDGLAGRYLNRSARPLALTFWWNRSLRVVDANGRAVVPGKGPELPCGVNEEWKVLAPGEVVVRPEPLACTQPAGRTEDIGWSYDLAPGSYVVTLIFEQPPAHGFAQCEPNALAFRGKVESTSATIDVVTPSKRTFLSRFFG